LSIDSHNQLDTVLDQESAAKLASVLVGEMAVMKDQATVEETVVM